MGILVLEFGSLGILRLEQDAPRRQHHDAPPTRSGTSSSPSRPSATATSTRSPTAGRVLGALIIVVGVGIFGTFTGYLANLFLARRPASDEPTGDDTRERVARLRTLLTEQQSAIDELDRLLADRSTDPPG